MMIADKLRKSILQAAIQGKLTEQLPTDGDARDLLEKIRAEKQRLIKEKKIKKESLLPAISDEEIPFDIPDNWCWVRLGDIVQIKGGKRIPAGSKLTTNETKHKYIRVADMHNGTILSNDIHYITDDVYLKIKNYNISSDDVYITCAGTIGRIGTVPKEFDGANLTENADKLVFAFLDKNWLKFVLMSSFSQEQIIENTTQVGQPKLAIKRIALLLIPLPPLDEQLRIVEKVNELMTELNSLEKDEQILNQLQNDFPKRLKASFLQAAIQGKLTEQLPDDGDARDLLQSIQQEKEKLIKEKKLKPEKPMPPISDDEIPFYIPDNWCWCRLGDIFQINLRNKSINDDTDVSFMPMNLLNDYYNNSFESNMRKWKDIKNNFTHFADNDVVFAKITPCFQNLKSAVMKNLINGIGAGTTELHVLRAYNNLIYSEYALYFVKSPIFIKDGLSNLKGTAGQQRISSDFVKNYLFPLPPLAEQKRIVARLEELLKECDYLSDEV